MRDIKAVISFQLSPATALQSVRNDITMKTLIVVFLVAGIAIADEKAARHEKRGIEELGYGGYEGGFSFGGGPGISENHEHVKTIIITKEIKVPVPQPYPVEVIKKVPYPVKVPVEVKVEKPYPVEVPKPYPVYVEKKVPYPVEKRVPYPVNVPVKVPYPVPHPVHVPKPYPVHVTKPVPVPHPVYIERKIPVYLKNHDDSYVGLEGLGFESSHSNYGYIGDSY
ncbi:tetra-peptide repeat homeobox protein 1-like [Zootermopsis nevadensis]|uniref:tetra-peptide repeat homeobox protein 1-like n=1 Tax=Zootermopsis nevadensis TaxID=136037 RepID=UPI000B8E4FB9|nr:tetra-peptide repeat homeobox protein 1-like [Zootermopsis nevadensis]